MHGPDFMWEMTDCNHSQLRADQQRLKEPSLRFEDEVIIKGTVNLLETRNQQQILLETLAGYEY